MDAKWMLCDFRRLTMKFEKTQQKIHLTICHVSLATSVHPNAKCVVVILCSTTARQVELAFVPSLILTLFSSEVLLLLLLSGQVQ